MEARVPSAQVVIAVATFRRPADIARCLRSLFVEVAKYRADAPGRPVRIVVVDNDADASGRDAVRGTTAAHADDVPVAYLVEPTPGISAARNRALREADDAELLIFIDDDEEVVPGWLGHLLDTFDRWQPAAVAGRVVSAFSTPLDPWLEQGGFFRR